ncbi:type II toxin-antitoxin system Phd/YefM family antitoxin [Agrococcus sp. KRD186]|uniref:type II toxin-antitoxin system Phd/YefM family antitoxin n=1 Tax=Agrococcus sp. KRD186 TaxID=2729730 RepID=UPI0019D2A952|nr:type II toxin-antitoxin system prevent-host-death family antitoxin [Agrococcus sp. KRD186]
MRTISATEASRQFSDLLDAVEAGETLTVTRGGRKVVEIRPARRATGRDLRAALAGTDAPDERVASDISAAIDDLSGDG